MKWLLIVGLFVFDGSFIIKVKVPMPDEATCEKIATEVKVTGRKDAGVDWLGVVCEEQK